VASPVAPRQRASAGERVARASDRLLDVLLVVFASWTVVYHACLVLHVGAGWAAGLWALVAVSSGWLVLRGERRALTERPPREEPPPADQPPLAEPPPADQPPREEPPPADQPPLAARPRAGALRRAPLPLALPRILLAATVAAAVLAAGLFAFATPRWTVIWLLWVAAGGGALAYVTLRPARDHHGTAPPDGASGASSLDAAVVLAWTLGLAVLSLFLVGADADDAYYVHVSSWIEAYGRFPLRDVVFSHDVFPALYFPPASSYEALVGTLAHVTSVATPSIVYLAVPPVASALAVLALWRLLRAWGVGMVAVALSVALLFLLFDATHHNALGSFFVGRIWQGKVIFLAVLVPLLFALLHEYATAPARRRLALLAVAGTAGVGLTTTAVFVVPIIAFGCLAPLARRSLSRAVAGLVATAAYPLAAGVVTLAVGGRTPDVYTDADVIAPNLVHHVLGTDVPALLAVLAALLGPLLIRRATPARMVAATVLLVGLLVAPDVPRLIFHATGLGRVLWRLTWVIPVAALLGVLAAGLAARLRPAPLRVLPAVVLAVAVVLAGRPVWSSAGESPIRDHPSWKREPTQVRAARRILAHARPGDVVLAPRPLSTTLLVMSGRTTTVSPRGFYTRALAGVPAAHVHERLLLQRFVGVAAGMRTGAPPPARQVRRALRVVGVDLACVPRHGRAAQRVVVAAGYAPAVRTRALVCLRPG
jgi:Family of unknown function (DUF6077)